MPGFPALPPRSYGPSDNTRGEPIVYSGMTIYELLRSMIRSLKWSYENENDAIAFVDQLEQIGFFGSMADTIKSKEITRE